MNHLIKHQILYSKIVGVAAEMYEFMRHTATAPAITEQESFSTALLTNQLRLAAQIQGEPSHLFGLRDSVRSLFHYFSYDIQEGDVLVVADPYSGGTDPQTITLAIPVFYDGEIIFIPSVRAPLLDLAGEYPGDLHPEAKDIWQQSIRVTPIKLYRAGILQKDIFRFLTKNSRTPKSIQADIKAMIAVCRRAGQSIENILTRYDRNALDQAIDAMLHYSRKRMEVHVGGLSQDQYQYSINRKTTDFGNLKIEVVIKIIGGSLWFDFRGSSQCSESAINLTQSGASAFATLPFLLGPLDELTINEGVLEPFQFSFPKNSILNPQYPAATNLGVRVTGQLVTEAVTSALKHSTERPEFGNQLHGNKPIACLYDPIGSSQTNVPVVLNPGFSISAQGWGSPLIEGRQLLPSAEEIEIRDGIHVSARELNNRNQMCVTMVNNRGSLEGNFFLLNNECEKSGQIKIDGMTIGRTSSVCVPIPYGASIEFTYPTFLEPSL